MKKPAILSEIEQLRNELRDHEIAYYIHDAPTISDAEFDAKMLHLRELEAAHPEFFSEHSPTQRVGGMVAEGFEATEHTAQMLSLDSSPDKANFDAFDARIHRELEGAEVRYSVEPKIDGLSIELVYENGELARAVTRGDGTVGENITNNVRTIRGVPLSLRNSSAPAPDLLAIRGEIFMDLNDFRALNASLEAEGKQTFVNPRNAAAGSVRQLDPAVTASRKLRIYCFDILVGYDQFETQHDMLKAMAAWGLPTDPRTRSNVATADEAWQYLQELGEQRAELPYEIDGLVVKLENLHDRDELGFTSHHPRWAYALKFPALQSTSRIVDIELGVGRTGVIAPVAILEPVFLGGVTVTRASLHNFDEIARKDIRIGDRVVIERAGDVIPYIPTRVLDQPDDERGEPYAPPTVCPSCGEPASNNGLYVVCTNRYRCPAQLASQLEHFGSRAALDIMGLGESTVAAMLESGMVTKLSDLLTLTVDQVKALPGFAQRSAEKLVNEIEAKKHTTLVRLLIGIGIPDVGPTAARDLARAFGTIERLQAATVGELLAVEGIGALTSERIHDFFRQHETTDLLRELVERGLTIKPEDTNIGGDGVFSGKTVVLTGALQQFTRSQAGAIIEAAGGRVTSSVSKATDLLVYGERAGSKLAAAERHGVERWDEEQFVAFLAEHSLLPE